tara:strand:- start:785 stop:1339 length:555 start_codon:yes stop_codon:yes gene_type:complete
MNKIIQNLNDCNKVKLNGDQVIKLKIKTLFEDLITNDINEFNEINNNSALWNYKTLEENNLNSIIHYNKSEYIFNNTRTRSENAILKVDDTIWNNGYPYFVLYLLECNDNFKDLVKSTNDPFKESVRQENNDYNVGGKKYMQIISSPNPNYFKSNMQLIIFAVIIFGLLFISIRKKSKNKKSRR